MQSEREGFLLNGAFGENLFLGSLTGQKWASSWNHEVNDFSRKFILIDASIWSAVLPRFIA